MASSKTPQVALLARRAVANGRNFDSDRLPSEHSPPALNRRHGLVEGLHVCVFAGDLKVKENIGYRPWILKLSF